MRGSNLQDNCTMHSFPGRECLVEEDGHIGHGTVLHGCRIGRNSLIGMNSVIMDNAEVGGDSIIGAMSFLKSGTRVAERSLWAGVPARFIRELSPNEIEWKRRGTLEYQELARRCLEGLEPVTPLQAVEAGRPSLGGEHITLDEWRNR